MIAKLPKNDLVDWVLISGDLTNMAYAVKQRGHVVVFHNGKKGKPYDRILYPSMSKDGKEIIYWGFEGEKCSVVVNNREIHICDEEKSAPRVGPSQAEKMNIEVVSQGPKKAVRAQGKTGKFYDDVDIYHLQHGASPSRKLIYFAQDEEKWFAVIDGKEGKRYDNVKSPSLSADGNSVVYIARVGNQERAVFNEQEGSLFDHLFILFPFSPNGKKIVYRAKGNGEDFYVIQEGNQEQRIKALSTPRFSPDSLHITYIESSQNQQAVKIDNHPGKAFDKVFSPLFSHDGKYVGYSAQAGDQLWWVVDEVK